MVRKLEKKGNHALKHFYIFLKKTLIDHQSNVTKKDTLFETLFLEKVSFGIKNRCQAGIQTRNNFLNKR